MSSHRRPSHTWRALRKHSPAPGSLVRFGPIREQWANFRLTAAQTRLLAELTAVGTQRPVDKGIEVDLDSRLLRDGNCHWSGTTTFFYRGRYLLGTREKTHPVPSPDLAPAPGLTSFRMPGGGRWKFCQLTCDFNGIHLASAYALQLHFAAAFAHPQRAAALCLRQIDAPQNPVQSLDLWIKGPLYYDADVALAVLPIPQGNRFGLRLKTDPRFALAGEWCFGGCVR